MFSSIKNILISGIAVIILSMVILAGLFIYDIMDGVIDFQKQTRDCSGTAISVYPAVNSILIYQGADRKNSNPIGSISTSENKTITFYSNRNVTDNYKANTTPDINFVKKIRSCFSDYKLKFYQYKNSEEIGGEMSDCVYKYSLDSTEPFECKIKK